jgi:hypothetical protein
MLCLCVYYQVQYPQYQHHDQCTEGLPCQSFTTVHGYEDITIPHTVHETTTPGSSSSSGGS